MTNTRIPEVTDMTEANMTRLKRILVFALILVLAAGAMLPAGADAMSKNKKKKKKTPKPRVAVVDTVTTSSKRMVKVLRKNGFKVELIYTDAVDVARYDGLVIPGGNNIDPSIYGAERNEYTYGDDANKDRIQIKAILDFAAAGKPVLGICRGCQVVNVAFGGTINQHIDGWHKGNRRIIIAPGTWMYKKYGARPKVNHYHHQCVETLGEGLIATEWDAADGFIEGIQHVSLPVYGLQWHPDSMGKKGYKVFVKFRKTCIKYRKK